MYCKLKVSRTCCKACSQDPERRHCWRWAGIWPQCHKEGSPVLHSSMTGEYIWDKEKYGEGQNWKGAVTSTHRSNAPSRARQPNAALLDSLPENSQSRLEQSHCKGWSISHGKPLCSYKSRVAQD